MKNQDFSVSLGCGSLVLDSSDLTTTAFFLSECFRNGWLNNFVMLLAFIPPMPGQRARFSSDTFDEVQTTMYIV